MDYDRMYSEALSQEEKALSVVSLLIMVVACLFFFAALLIKEPLFGVPVDTMKTILVVTALVVMLGSIIPKFIAKNQKVMY